MQGTLLLKKQLNKTAEAKVKILLLRLTHYMWQYLEM